MPTYTTASPYPGATPRRVRIHASQPSSISSSSTATSSAFDPSKSIHSRRNHPLLITIRHRPPPPAPLPPRSPRPLHHLPYPRETHYWEEIPLSYTHTYGPQTHHHHYPSSFPTHRASECEGWEYGSGPITGRSSSVSSSSGSDVDSTSLPLTSAADAARTVSGAGPVDWAEVVRQERERLKGREGSGKGRRRVRFA